MTDDRIIDCNGQKYRVYWDEHGWFTIQMVELRPVDGAAGGDVSDVVEYDDEEYWYETVGEYPNTSFPPAAVEELVAAIEEGNWR